jgi:hypothetical protein
MPNRLIKESICTSEKISKLSDFNFRLWVSLITYVDDFGRGDARAAIIKGRCFPLRERVTVRDIDAGLHVLADTGCIFLYESDGESYLCFPNWDKHQTVRNQKSKYPAPPEIESRLQPTESNCKQLQTIDSKCPRNPIQSNPNPNPNPNPKRAGAGFEKFWSAYPRHVAKSDAQKKFEKLNPDDELLAVMLAAIEKQKKSEQWVKDGGQYIPHPSTWLNQRRWEDEVQPAKPVKVLPAQQYEQRDYSGVQAEIESELDREMEEYMKSQRDTG